MHKTFDSNIHHRRSIRLKEYDYSEPGAYFITICTKDRQCLFGGIKNRKMIFSELGKIVKNCWQEIPIHFDNVNLDLFIIMPNHLHGIIYMNDSICRGLINQTPTEKWILQKTPKLVLGKIIRSYKAYASRIAHKNGFHDFQWQRNYYEHIIRNDNELNRIREYIINNPFNWELDRNKFTL